MRSSRFLPASFFTLSLVLLCAACGDVGDAPAAETGEAVNVAQGEGDVLPIDTSRSEINWKAAKVTRAHDGGFESFTGTVTVNGSEVTGVNLTIDTPSIWSDTDRLTGHLQNEDFFEVVTFPTATFEANQFAPVDSAGATHLVTGNLTMRDQTRSVTFPATISVEDGTVEAQADFIIQRSDWGLNYTGAPDDLIEEQVRIIFDIVASTDQAVAAAGGQAPAEDAGMVE